MQTLNNIIGIDPSFSSTGVVCYSDKLLRYSIFKSGYPVYKGIDLVHKGCQNIVNGIKSFIRETPDVHYDVIIEYPAFATSSGAYLAILNGYLQHFLLHNSQIDLICSVPPNACDSFVKNKMHQKQFLVDYCLNNNLIPKVLNHDICTAVILSELFKLIRIGKYKNSFFIEHTYRNG